MMIWVCNECNKERPELGPCYALLDKVEGEPASCLVNDEKDTWNHPPVWEEVIEIDSQTWEDLLIAIKV